MKVGILEGQEQSPPVKIEDSITKAIKGVPGPVWVILAAKFLLKWI